MILDLQRYLNEELRDFASGNTRVLGVRVEEGEDLEGEERLVVTVTLSDPPPGLETWRADEVAEIERRLDALIAGQRPGRPWYVRLAPEHPAELESELSAPSRDRVCARCGRRLKEGRWIVGRDKRIGGGRRPRYCWPGEGCNK